MNKAAQALGKLAKGKPKTLTKAERKRRKESLAQAREKRWPVKKDDILANASRQESMPGRAWQQQKGTNQNEHSN